MNAPIRPHMEMVRHVSRKPFLHQVDAYAKGCDTLEYSGCYALLHDMGAGKSMTAVALIGEMRRRHNIRSVLIICPSSVVPSWAIEFEHASYDVHVYPLQGNVAKREDAVRKALDVGANRLTIFVTNYEALHRMHDTLVGADIDMIICDESQRIKAPGSKQSRAAHALGKRARFRMILSGTPIPEGALGWYAQFRFLNQRIFGTSFVAFRTKYAVERDFGSFRKVVGFRNMDDLERIVMRYSHRVRKDEALDLPEEIDVRREFVMPPKAMKLYAQIVQDSVASIEESGSDITAENILTRLLRLQQLAGGFVNDDDGVNHHIHDDKLNLLFDVLDDTLDAGGKAVVFHRFTAEGAAIRDGLAKRGIGYTHIDGSVASNLRGENVRSFQEDSDVRVFVAQIQAAGLGITLTAANTSIFYSTGYSSADYQQARARTHRIGQHHPVSHIALVASGTVDEHIQKALVDKRNIADDFVDGGWRRYLYLEGSHG